MGIDAFDEAIKPPVDSVEVEVEVFEIGGKVAHVDLGVLVELIADILDVCAGAGSVSGGSGKGPRFAVSTTKNEVIEGIDVAS